MVKNEIVKFMIDGLEKLSSDEITKMFHILKELNNELDYHDKAIENIKVAFLLKTSFTIKSKCAVLIHDIFDKYRDSSDVQIYSDKQNKAIKTSVALMKLYIETDKWDRLWALIGIS